MGEGARRIEKHRAVTLWSISGSKIEKVDYRKDKAINQPQKVSMQGDTVSAKKISPMVLIITGTQNHCFISLGYCNPPYKQSGLRKALGRDCLWQKLYPRVFQEIVIQGTIPDRLCARKLRLLPTFGCS